jgi:hypothetical protein
MLHFIYCYAEYHMLNVVMLSVVMLNVVMLSVVAPLQPRVDLIKIFWCKLTQSFYKGV